MVSESESHLRRVGPAVLPSLAGERPVALAADDDPALLALVAECLARAGYRVVTAPDGDRALSVARSHALDLAVLDVDMPAMSGLEVTRRLRSAPDEAGLPVILLSARVTEADIERGFEAGATLYCRKPFSPRELMEVVTRIGGERALRERERREGRRAAQEAAMRRVATVAAASPPLEALLSLVAGEAARLLGADVGRVCRLEDGEVVVVAEERPPPTGDEAAGQLDPIPPPALTRDPVRRRGAGAPVWVAGRLWGALSVAGPGRVRADDEPLLAELADLVGLTIASTEDRERLERLTLTDHLTGLANRRAFEECLDEALHRARRGGGPLSVAVLDVDHFKRVNDAHGHDVGDAVLIETARRLRASMRGGGLVARLGGEEFGCILPDLDEGSALVATSRVQSVAAAEPFPRIGSLDLSAGVAELATGESAADLLRRADLALYAAKRAGRGRCATASGAVVELT